MKTTVTTSFRYSAKQNPSDRDSAWIGSEVGYSIEVEGDIDKDKLTDELMKDAKLQVFTTLGVEFDENMQPIQVVASPPVQQTPRRKYERDNKPAASQQLGDLPSIEFEGVTYFDYREAKSQGKVKPAFPDFKSTDGKESHWILDRDGGRTEFAEAIGV